MCAVFLGLLIIFRSAIPHCPTRDERAAAITVGQTHAEVVAMLGRPEPAMLCGTFSSLAEAADRLELFGDWRAPTVRQLLIRYLPEPIRPELTVGDYELPIMVWFDKGDRVTKVR